MSAVTAAVIVFVVVVGVVPALVLGASLPLGGRRALRLLRGSEPTIQSFLMLAVLTVVAVGLAFVVPFAAAFGGLPHAVTGVEGVFLAVLVLLGVGYAWRRGVLRWQ